MDEAFDQVPEDELQRLAPQTVTLTDSTRSALERGPARIIIRGRRPGGEARPVSCGIVVWSADTALARACVADTMAPPRAQGIDSGARHP